MAIYLGYFFNSKHNNIQENKTHLLCLQSLVQTEVTLEEFVSLSLVWICANSFDEQV